MTTERRQSLYTNSGYVLYDNTFTSLQMGFVDNNGFIKIAAINKEFVNKKPKKGDRVYDYDNAISYHLNAKDALVLLTMIEKIENNEIHQAEYTTGVEGEVIRKFKIMAPESVKLGTVKYPNYIIKFVKQDNTDSNNSSTTFHLFEKTEYVANKDEVIEIHTGLLIFKKFLESIVSASSNSFFHGAKKANNGSSSAGKTRRSFSSNVTEEEDDENSSKEVTSASTSLNSEFDD